MGMAGQGRGRVERRLLAAAASPAARARTRLLRRFVVTWVAVSALAMVVVGRSAATAVADYRVDRLEAQIAALTATHRVLEAQVQALEAAPRLSRVAAASGLVLPQTLDTLPVAATRPTRLAQRRQAVSAVPLWQRLATAVARWLRRLP